jgi:hypothetical protein
VELRRLDGRRIRTLVARSQAGNLPDWLGLDLSPDRKTLYFVRHSSDSCAEIVRVATAGGAIEVIASGTSVAISPDGRTLAYADSWNCGRRDSRAIVRDLATGVERSMRDTFGGGVSWMPDGRLLYDRCGADSCASRALDPETMRVVDETPFRLPSYVDHMNVFVVGNLRRGRTAGMIFHIAYSSEDGTEPHPILEYDTKTFRTRALFERSRGAGVLDFDASGNHMLYKTRDRRLFHYDGHRARLIATGITAAVW